MLIIASTFRRNRRVNIVSEAGGDVAVCGVDGIGFTAADRRKYERVE